MYNVLVSYRQPKVIDMLQHSPQNDNFPLGFVEGDYLVDWPSAKFLHSELKTFKVWDPEQRKIVQREASNPTLTQADLYETDLHNLTLSKGNKKAFKKADETIFSKLECELLPVRLDVNDFINELNDTDLNVEVIQIRHKDVEIPIDNQSFKGIGTVKMEPQISPEAIEELISSPLLNKITLRITDHEFDKEYDLTLSDPKELKIKAKKSALRDATSLLHSYLFDDPDKQRDRLPVEYFAEA